jgi:hypothetical protein
MSTASTGKREPLFAITRRRTSVGSVRGAARPHFSAAPPQPPNRTRRRAPSPRRTRRHHHYRGPRRPPLVAGLPPAVEWRQPTLGGGGSTGLPSCSPTRMPASKDSQESAVPNGSRVGGLLSKSCGAGCNHESRLNAVWNELFAIVAAAATWRHQRQRRNVLFFKGLQALAKGASRTRRSCSLCRPLPLHLPVDSVGHLLVRS